MEADLAAMRAIHNDVVLTSNAVFTESERSADEHRLWWRQRVEAALPVLVALNDEEVVGYASSGPFRPWPGYRQTVEHSIHVRASLALHEAHGFRQAGRLHEVAIKHGGWLDLVFLERRLAAA
jgi:L-amino acid N-acyltransferase YncA